MSETYGYKRVNNNIEIDVQGSIFTITQVPFHKINTHSNNIFFSIGMADVFIVPTPLGVIFKFVYRYQNYLYDDQFFTLSEKNGEFDLFCPMYGGRGVSILKMQNVKSVDFQLLYLILYHGFLFSDRPNLIKKQKVVRRCIICWSFFFASAMHPTNFNFKIFLQGCSHHMHFMQPDICNCPKHTTLACKEFYYVDYNPAHGTETFL